jgi:hypothetical protein
MEKPSMIFQTNIRGLDLFLRDFGAYFLFWFAGYIGPMLFIWMFHPAFETGIRLFTVLAVLPLLFVALGICFGRKILILHSILLVPLVLFVWYSYRNFNPNEGVSSPDELLFYSGLIGVSLAYLGAPVLKFGIGYEWQGLLHRVKNLRDQGGLKKRSGKLQTGKKRKST